MPRLRFLLTSLIALLSLLCFQAHAQTPGKVSSTARLVSENLTIAPGETFTVALELGHPAEWHSYYRNSGGVELSPSIEWKLPEGFSAGPIQWPVPEIKDGYFGKSFIYSGTPVFLIDLRAPATLPAGETFSIEATAKWQICKESCIDESASFALTLSSAGTAGKNPAFTRLFEEARAKLPGSGEAWKTAATSSGGEIELRLEAEDAAFPFDAEGVDFVPDQPFVKSISDGGNLRQDGNTWVIALGRNTIDFLDQPISQGGEISGILTHPDGRGVMIAAVPIAPPPAKPLATGDYLPILWGMLLGGLVLNLMPCVFPVIGLKIMGFVQQAGHDRKKIAGHGLIFTLGVLASFGVLSGVLFAARAAALAGGKAETLGWGYQLQNPWVVLTLLLLMFVLALNMFGIFEIGTSATSVGGSLQSKHGVSGSFFSGVLATIVATPCSAPFLGVAIGTAVSLPAGQFFGAFAAMAIGLSLPYLILSLFPQLLERLPRPGPWMESFKQAMSFLLFATAGYLLWVYADQIGLDNLLAPIFGLTLIAIAAWIYGRWCLPHLPKPRRVIAVFLALLFAVGGVFLIKPPKSSGLTWETWSQERVDELLESDTPVYIDFTARWCVTCQVNKKRAYTPAVIALMKEKGIVALKADKTNPNPTIDAKLNELGRTAIPVNVLQAPGGKPIVTPELLSEAYLLELFEKEIPSK